MKTAIFLALALATLAAIAGCAKPGDIVPGKPFVVLHDADAGCVKERLLVLLAERGWTIVSSSEGRLTAENRAPPFINTAARRAGYAAPLVRMNLLGLDKSPNIEIVVDPYIVNNPGTRSEKMEPMEPTAEMQTVLDSAARRLEGECRRKA